MKIFETYNICRTGKTKQFFTLYIERLLINGCFEKYSCYFVQNLAHDRDEAIDKVEMMVAKQKIWGKNLEDHVCSIDFCDSKKREYCDLKSFGINWKKSKKGFYIRIDHLPNIEDRQMIWDAWRTDKDLLKEAGFSLYPGKKGQWFFFFKNCSNEEMDKKLTTLKVIKNNKVVIGKFVGKIKERINTKATLKDIKKRDNRYGTTHTLTFEATNQILISFYTGRKDIPEIGKEVNLTGTVKAHKEFNGINQTVLNRINF